MPKLQLLNELDRIKIANEKWNERFDQLTQSISIQLNDEPDSFYETLIEFKRKLELVFEPPTEQSSVQLLPLIEDRLNEQLQLPFAEWFTNIETHVGLFNQHYEALIRLLDLCSDIDYLISIAAAGDFLEESFPQSVTNWVEEFCIRANEGSPLEELLEDLQFKKQLVNLLVTYIYATLQSTEEEIESEPEINLPRSIYSIEAVRSYVKTMHFDNPVQAQFLPELFAVMAMLTVINQNLQAEDSCFHDRYTALKDQLIEELAALVVPEAAGDSSSKIYEIFKYVDLVTAFDKHLCQLSTNQSVNTSLLRGAATLVANRELTSELYTLMTSSSQPTWSFEFGLKKLCSSLESLLRSKPVELESELYAEFKRFYQDPQNYESLEATKAARAHTAVFSPDANATSCKTETAPPITIRSPH
jgi:hypothetical protein